MSTRPVYDDERLSEPHRRLDVVVAIGEALRETESFITQHGAVAFVRREEAAKEAAKHKPPRIYVAAQN